MVSFPSPSPPVAVPQVAPQQVELPQVEPPRVVHRKRRTPPASQAVPRLLRSLLRLSNPVSRPLLHPPPPPIAAAVRGAAQPAPAQAASVLSAPTQPPGLRPQVSQN